MIEKIYIVSHRYDLLNLSVCIGSILYWCPEIKIEIIVNENNGKFSFFKPNNSNILLNSRFSNVIGTFYGSIIPFIEEDGCAVILDSDTAILSSLHFLELKNSCDIIVDFEIQQNQSKVKDLYFDVDKLNQRFDFLRKNNFTFNNGIISFNGSKFSIEDFNEHFVKDDFFSLRLKDSSGLKCHDQSLINLVVNYKSHKKEINVSRNKFMIYPPESNLNEDLLFSNLLNKIPFEKVIHWADTKGAKPKPFKNISNFYFNFFRSNLSFKNRIIFKLFLNYISAEKKIKSLYTNGKTYIYKFSQR